MILYLQDQGFTVSRKMSEKDIVEMYGLVVDQIAETRKRLLRDQADCFGDFVEELAAGCSTPDFDCMLMGSCKRMTALQALARRLESVPTPVPEPARTPASATPAGPSLRGKKPSDEWGFAKRSKLSRMAKVIADEPGIKMSALVAKLAHKFHIKEDAARTEFSKMRYEARSRGVLIDVGADDVVTIIKA